MKRSAIMSMAALFYSAFLSAAVTIDIEESGGNVVATASGTLDTSALTLLAAEAPFYGFVAGSAWNASFDSVILVGSGNRDTYDIGAQSITFSTGAGYTATSNTGGIVAIGSRSTGNNTLNVPQGYVSGSPLSSTSTWSGQTIAGMGLIPGSFTFSWAGDSLTINVLSGSYSVGGTLSGLTGSVTLQNNGGDDLVLGADGAFTFTTPVDAGNPYAVTVSAQPADQTCTVTNGSGTVTTADITDVQVACVDNSTPPPGGDTARPVPVLPLPGLVLMILGVLVAGGARMRSRASRR